MFDDKEIMAMDGKHFAELRKRYHIRRSVFCRWSGYEQSTVWKWETGRNPLPLPGVRLLVAYIEKFRGGFGHDKTTTP